MICTESLNHTLQQHIKSFLGAHGADSGRTVPDADGVPPVWLMEVGVVGFGGTRWCRVRTFFESGRLHSWQVLEYLP